MEIENGYMPLLYSVFGNARSEGTMPNQPVVVDKIHLDRVKIHKIYDFDNNKSMQQVFDIFEKILLITQGQHESILQELDDQILFNYNHQWLDGRENVWFSYSKHYIIAILRLCEVLFEFLLSRVDDTLEVLDSNSTIIDEVAFGTELDDLKKIRIDDIDFTTFDVTTADLNQYDCEIIIQIASEFIHDLFYDKKMRT